jgi:hypothetical protein
MIVENWVIIPDKLVEAIENICVKNCGSFTIANFLFDLTDFAETELQRYDVSLWSYYKDQRNNLSEDTLKRALNKRPDNGVYYKNNKNLLDLLCYYAFKKNWSKALQYFGIEEKEIKVRTIAEKKLAKEIQREIKKIIEEKGNIALVLISNALKDIKEEFTDSGHIIIDVSQVSNKPNDIIEYKLNSLKSFSALSNAVYYYLVEYIRPYYYGYDWVLRDSKTKSVFKSVRMISGSPPGIRMPDLRTLEDLGIKNGMHLTAINLKNEYKESIW